MMAMLSTVVFDGLHGGAAWTLLEGGLRRQCGPQDRRVKLRIARWRLRQRAKVIVWAASWRGYSGLPARWVRLLVSLRWALT